MIHPPLSLTHFTRGRGVTEYGMRGRAAAYIEEFFLLDFFFVTVRARGAARLIHKQGVYFRGFLPAPKRMAYTCSTRAHAEEGGPIWDRHEARYESKSYFCSRQKFHRAYMSKRDFSPSNDTIILK